MGHFENFGQVKVMGHLQTLQNFADLDGPKKIDKTTLGESVCLDKYY